MDLLIAVGALVLLMLVAYRGFSVILFAPIAAMLAVLLDRSRGSSCRLHRRLHGEDGRLREVVLPGVPARRRVRQGHRTVGLLQIYRLGGDRSGRARARHAVDRTGGRYSDLWGRLAVRGCVRGLSVRGRDVPAGRDPEAAHPRHDRIGRIHLHHGLAAGHAADPEHHPDDLLQDRRLGRPRWLGTIGALFILPAGWPISNGAAGRPQRQGRATARATRTSPSPCEDEKLAHPRSPSLPLVIVGVDEHRSHRSDCQILRRHIRSHPCGNDEATRHAGIVPSPPSGPSKAPF